MTINYLYIDDENIQSLQPYIRAVKGDSDDINIQAESPKPFEEQLTYLSKVLNDFDGLLLDWRLDQKPNNGVQVQFRAAALAQEVRTRATEGEMKDLPIVLWSTYPKLKNSFNEDNTSHDLFDKRYDKDDLTEHPHTVRAEFLSLVQGYKDIFEAKKTPQMVVGKILHLEKSNYDELDARFISHLTDEGPIPVHEYARFLLRMVIQRPGPLISEEVLAARLGVDKVNSPDWQRFLERLLELARYQGPFHEGWPRWWSHIVEKKWWRSLNTGIRPLSVYGAEERVSILKEHTGIEGLVAARPLKESYSDNFQTICEYYRSPLDPLDGVIIDEKEPEPWQQRRYLSLDAALERLGEDQHLRPHPMEMQRIKEIRKSRTAHAEEQAQSAE